MRAKAARMGLGGVAALLLISFSHDDGWGRAFPYADRVPADAAVYVAVPDLTELLAQLQAHPEWVRALGLEPLLSRLESSRAWFAGPAAFYLRGSTWTALIRLKNGVTHVEGPEWSGSESMARALGGLENDPPRTRIVLNFGALPAPAREALGEFSLAVLEYEFGSRLRLHGMLTYRPGARDEVMADRVHAAPNPRPGEAAIGHTGFTNVSDLFRALGIEAPAPARILRALGPSWGFELRAADDIALWFEARGDALRIRPTDWHGFHVEIRDGRLHLWTKRPAEPGAPAGLQAETRIDSRAAAELLRGRADLAASILDRTRSVEIGARYYAWGASVEIGIEPR